MVPTLETNASSTFALLIFEYGVFGIIFIFYIFVSIIRSDLQAKYVVATILFMTWLQSFPAAYPLFWLLLGLHTNTHFSTARMYSARKGRA